MKFYNDWPLYEDFVKLHPTGNYPIFDGLSRDQLNDCMKVCECQLSLCSPLSAFVPLIKGDMAKIERLIEIDKLKKEGGV